jgi:hypothetical protein
MSDGHEFVILPEFWLKNHRLTTHKLPERRWRKVFKTLEKLYQSFVMVPTEVKPVTDLVWGTLANIINCFALLLSFMLKESVGSASWKRQTIRGMIVSAWILRPVLQRATRKAPPALHKHIGTYAELLEPSPGQKSVPSLINFTS